jgi:DegV family protein with EDD domain
VDAGAQGFVDFLHGIFSFIKNGNLKGFKTDLESKQIGVDIGNNATDFENSEFRFCTECIIMSDKIIHKDLRESLLTKGNSLVIAGSKKKAKVHIHVNDPSEVFKICTDFGTVTGEKADDMWQQQKAALSHTTKGVAIVTDSGADIPDDIDLNIYVVPVRYNFGNVGYIDKVSQTPEEFFQELEINPNHPQTSQPTPGDFRRQYQFLKSHYDSIISIHIPHELSGTYQSALNAAKRVDKENITVIDGFSASAGLGLIVMKAASLAKTGKSLEEINALLPDIISSSKVFLAIKDLKYVVRGGRLPAWVKSVADFLNIRPVLSTKDNGTLGAAGILLGTENLPQKLCKFVLSKMDKNTNYTVIVGHSNTLEDGKELLNLLQQGNDKIKKIYLIEIGCALGVHAGPGSLVTAIQPIG